ncbi:uncharacterized protein PHACADRAFT_211468 [Phanerochaete carnosa HHB-10118-sp]|uniref:F-box domain-containing protein n=1 Tax=Phanerochaete carnosa (strain HHB-10118-sp) TaxID=650164 RepID=K5VQV9_PHACS|nr:uncharacterized protein PHACADRAFT_211468 [Phanerochaete carnosa HHB-10118-sp]EKM53828.1 hypothetical protein PHACADRAFT_211468 [Phanerochaete carnosa HHB-10118-sp]
MLPFVHSVSNDWACDVKYINPLSKLSSLQLCKSWISPLAEDEVAEYLAGIFPLASIKHTFCPTLWERQHRPIEVQAGAVIERINSLREELAPSIARLATATKNIVGHVGMNSTLHSIALVCHAFVEPANDRLWVDLKGLKPLINCLPDYLVGASQASDNVLTIIKPPLPADWQRFRYHARQVKSLHVCHDNHTKYAVDAAAVEILARYYPGPILPNLAHLDWDSSALAKYAPLFIRHTLIAFWYEPAMEDEMRTVLKHIGTNAPSLEQLWFSLAACQTLGTLDSELSQTITSLSRLTTFAFHQTAPRSDVLMHLSRFRRLTTLKLRLCADSDGSIQNSQSSLTLGRSPKLKNLVVSLDNLTPASLILQTFSGSSLTSLKIYITPRTPVEDFGRVTLAISHLKCLQLCSIQFRFYVLPGDWENVVIDESTLSPLYQITGMRWFELNHHTPKISQPEAVRNLAATWKHLRELLLVPWSDHHCQLRLEDLSFLSRSCLSLVRLTVQITPVGDGWVCDVETHRYQPPSPLLYLHLCRSYISPRAEFQVAAYLANNFPSATISHDFPTRPRTWEWSQRLLWVLSGPPARELDAGETIERINELKKKLARDTSGKDRHRRL